MGTSRVEFDPNPTTTGREILSPSEERTAVTFFAPAANTVYLSNDSMSAIDQGIPLAAGESPIHLTYAQHGDSVKRAWFALYTAAAKPMAWIQTIR